MDTENDEPAAVDLHLVPKTPRARPPLPRLMMKDHAEQNQRTHRSDLKSHRSQDDANEDDSENSETDDNDTDEEINDAVRGDSMSRDSAKESPVNTRRRNVQNSPSQESQSLKKTERDFRSAEINKGLKESYAFECPMAEANVKKWDKRKFFTSLGLLSILALVLYVTVNYSSAQDTRVKSEPRIKDTKEEIIKKFEHNIDDLGVTFKNQNPHIWNDIIAGVTEVVKHPEKPAILLFFSNEDDPMSCLARMVGNVSKEALNSNDNLWISPADMGDDYGSVIEKFREQIRERKIVIIENLLAIHPEAMRAFHNMCDRESPLVKEAVYILTMVVKGYKKNQSPVKFIEDQLTRKLKGKIHDEKLQPLITRITDGAFIPVQPEPDVASCPLRY